MSLISGNEEVLLASSLYEGDNHIPYPGSPLVSLQSDIQSLLDNPLVPVAWVDGYGNEWCLFRLAIDAPTSVSGASITFRDLDIVYDWQRALSDSNNIAREMNQGVLLSGRGRLYRGHLSTKCSRCAPSRSHRQHQQHWKRYQSANEFHEKLGSHIIFPYVNHSTQWCRSRCARRCGRRSPVVP